MRLTTFNIRYDRGRDGWSDPENPRRARALAAIEAADADLLGLQEVLAPQLADLEAGLPGYRRIGVGRDDGAEAGEFAPLFLREAAFEVADSGTVWLSPTPDTPGTTYAPARLPRIATWADVVDRASGQPLRIINTHWDHQARAARAASARQLIDLASAAPAAVIMGDLNALSASGPVRRLRAAGFTDCWRALFPLRAAAATFHDWTGRTLGPRIDYILHRGPLATVTAAIDTEQRAGGWPSDHYPVHATLRWKTA